jgi:two-component system cell cycle response regulator DivK
MSALRDREVDHEIVGRQPTMGAGAPFRYESVDHLLKRAAHSPFPCLYSGPTDRRRAALLEDPNSPMPKILLVEDQEMNRDMLSRRLKKRGYEVLIAVDGAEGLEKARSEAPELILMDMSLPVIDGWEATRQLKADEATRNIPVVALTAHAMSTDREKALEAGCDAYETKPVELPKLLETMEKLLAR